MDYTQNEHGMRFKGAMCSGVITETQKSNGEDGRAYVTLRYNSEYTEKPFTRTNILQLADELQELALHMV